MLSVVNIILGALLVILGITAHRYIFNGVMADQALVLLGVTIILISALTIYLCIKNKKEALLG